MRNNSPFRIHLVFESQLLSTMDNDSLERFLATILHPVVTNHAHKTARQLLKAETEQAQDMFASKLFVSQQAARVTYARDSWTLTNLGNGLVDFSFGHENNQPDYDVVDEHQRRVHLRESIRKDVLSTFSLSILDSMQDDNTPFVVNLMNAFWSGYRSSARQIDEIMSHGIYIEGEVSSARH
jgi:hypothetical protein